MFLRMDRWWPQQLRSTVHHRVRAMRSHCYSPHRAEECRGAAQVPLRAVSAGGGGKGAVGVQRGSWGAVEERGAQGCVAAALTAQAGILDAGWSVCPLCSRPRLVRPFPGLSASPPRLRAPPCPPGCAPGAPPSFYLALVPLGIGKAHLLARKSCAGQSGGRSPGTQRAVAKAMHQRRLRQQEGGFREGSLR